MADSSNQLQLMSNLSSSTALVMANAIKNNTAYFNDSKRAYIVNNKQISQGLAIVKSQSNLQKNKEDYIKNSRVVFATEQSLLNSKKYFQSIVEEHYNEEEKLYERYEQFINFEVKFFEKKDKLQTDKEKIQKEEDDLYKKEEKHQQKVKSELDKKKKSFEAKKGKFDAEIAANNKELEFINKWLNVLKPRVEGAADYFKNIQFNMSGAISNNIEYYGKIYETGIFGTLKKGEKVFEGGFSKWATMAADNPIETAALLAQRMRDKILMPFRFIGSTVKNIWHGGGLIFRAAGNLFKSFLPGGEKALKEKAETAGAKINDKVYLDKQKRDKESAEKAENFSRENFVGYADKSDRKSDLEKENKALEFKKGKYLNSTAKVTADNVKNKEQSQSSGEIESDVDVTEDKQAEQDYRDKVIDLLTQINSNLGGKPEEKKEENKTTSGSILGWLLGLLTPFKGVISSALNFAKKGFSKVWSWTKTGLSKAWNLAKSGFSKTWNLAKSGFSKTWNWTKNIGNKIAQPFKGITTRISGMFGRVTRRIGGMFSRAANAVSRAARRMGRGFGGGKFGRILDLVNIGVDIARQAKNAVSGVTKTAASATKSVVNAGNSVAKAGAKTIAKTGTSVAKAGASAAKAGTKALLKGGARLGANALKAIPGVGLIATAGMAIFDAVDGWNNAAEISGKREEDLTTTDKALASTASVLSGLTFGLVDASTVFDGLDWVADKWTKSWDNLTNVTENAAKLTGKAEEDLTFWDKTKAFGAGLLSNMTGGLVSMETMYKGVDGVCNAVESVKNAVCETASAAWDGAKNLASNAWEGTKNFFGGIWDSAKNVAGKAWDGLKNAGSAAWDGAKNLASNAWNGIKNVGSFVSDGIGKTVGFFVNTIKKNIDTVKKIAGYIGKGFLTVFGWIKDGIKKVGNFFAGLFNPVINLIKKAGNGIKGVIDKVINNKWFKRFFGDDEDEESEENKEVPKVEEIKKEAEVKIEEFIIQNPINDELDLNTITNTPKMNIGAMNNVNKLSESEIDAGLITELMTAIKNQKFVASPVFVDQNKKDYMGRVRYYMPN